MKIVAPRQLKVKLMLFSALCIILATLTVGSRLVTMNDAIDAAATSLGEYTVVIDAGHGGIDGGTSAADGTPEKTLNLQIAEKLRLMLDAMGVKTVMTRGDDDSIHDPSATTIRQKKISDIKNRLKIIENTDNAVFVSIHQNHFGDSKYHGTQVFYSKNDPGSKMLAEAVRAQIITNLQKDNTREVKQSGTEIYLLYHANVPAVMVECGFLSNAEETAKLKDEGYQRELAFLTALGVVEYLSGR